MGPTSANGCPGRFVFLTTPESKERLVPALMEKNVEKTRKAPVTAIVAWDMEFYEKFPKLTPTVDWKPFFAGNQPLIEADHIQKQLSARSILDPGCTSAGLRLWTHVWV